jgi:hypothetical protein
MSLQSNTNNDIFIIPSQSLMEFSGSDANPIVLYVEPSGSVNFVGTTGSILKIMDNLSGSLFSVNNISGLPILEVLSDNIVNIGNPTNYALIVSGSNVIITGSLVDKETGVKFLVVDTTTGVVHTTGSGGGGGATTPGGSPTQIQYNSASVFGGVPVLTYDGTTLIATGSFTGSFTGSLLGTASFADSSSQAISASYVNISSSNIATLEVSYATPGVIALLAKTGSGASSQGNINSLQYNAGGGLFGGVNSSSYNNITGQTTLGNLIATGSFSGSLTGTATTASYVNLVAGPRIQAINYNGPVISITGSIGGSDTHIQFNSGSAFSGSNNFIYNYTNNTARLTGSLIVTGSVIITGSFSNDINSTIAYQPRIVNVNTGSTSGVAFYIQSGNDNVSGSRFYISSLHKGYISPNGNPPQSYYSGGTALILTPGDLTGDAQRPMKYLSAILGTPSSSSFEWHYRSTFNIDATTLKMRLDVPSGTLSNSGSIVTSGSLTVASGSINTSNDCAIYFGTSGSINSWRIAPSGNNLVIQKWDGSTYTGGTTITP